MTRTNGFEQLSFALWVRNLAGLPVAIQKSVSSALVTASYGGRVSSELRSQFSSCSMRAINSAGWMGLVR